MNKEEALSIRDISQTGVFTALTAIAAFISIPIGPVPITLQSLFVLLSGVILGAKKAAYSQIAYLLLGLIGFPIFSGFSGGLQHILKPSFGFIIGYIAAAYLVGKLTENKSLNNRTLFIAIISGTLTIYAFGLPYMYFILNSLLSSGISIFKAIEIGMLAFIPGDTIKALIAIYIGKKVKSFNF